MKMKYFSSAVLVFVYLNITEIYGIKSNQNKQNCTQAQRNSLIATLNVKNSKGVKLIDQAGTYNQRVSAMTKYNQEAGKANCNKYPNDLLTEQDHMPPKASLQGKASKLRDALGGGPFGSSGNMLAMTYLKPGHRNAATTGTLKGSLAVRNLIKEAISANDIVKTYKYSVLSTNTLKLCEINTVTRNFSGYLQKSIERLEEKKFTILTSTKKSLQKWTREVPKNETRTFADEDFNTLLHAYCCADQENNYTKCYCQNLSC